MSDFLVFVGEILSKRRKKWGANKIQGFQQPGILKKILKHAIG